MSEASVHCTFYDEEERSLYVQERFALAAGETLRDGLVTFVAERSTRFVNRQDGSLPAASGKCHAFGYVQQCDQPGWFMFCMTLVVWPDEVEVTEVWSEKVQDTRRLYYRNRPENRF